MEVERKEGGGRQGGRDVSALDVALLRVNILSELYKTKR